MSDVLIRDVPDEVLTALDHRAKRLGLSRSEYLRRSLIRDARVTDTTVTVDDLRAFAQRLGDLGDPDVMSRRLVVTIWLIDKSALVRLGGSPDAVTWADRIARGLIRITTLTRLEVGFSARSGVDLQTSLGHPPLSAMPVEFLTPAVEQRAEEVQRLLADRGHHRAPSVPDLLIAATAELADLTVLHLDKDFELIAQVTGQPQERLA